MINYLFAHSGKPLPPFDAGKLFEYIVAANGVFIRAEKPGLSVLLKVQPLDPIGSNALRVLDALKEHIAIEKMPASVLEAVIQQSEYALPNEMLFYLRETADSWELTIPEQRASPGRVEPVDPDDPAAQNALCEIHSHGHLEAFFSETDDREEAFGFRIYCVIGTPPGGRYGYVVAGQRVWQIRCRVGVYGHFVEVPAEWLFDELPAELLALRMMVESAGEEMMYDIPDPD